MSDSLPVRVQVVADDLEYRQLVTYGLELQGFEVLSGADLDAAQRLAREEELDAVVVDLLMPVLDGLSFIEWMRKEANLPTPAILLAAEDDAQFQTRALLVGATEVVVKPVSLTVLCERIQAVAERSVAARASRSQEERANDDRSAGERSTGDDEEVAATAEGAASARSSSRGVS